VDFKKFGKVILILGVVILSYGALKWLSNQPKASERHGNVINHFDNSEADSNRSAAITILVAGGLVAVVGLGISYSSTSKE
jgi:hypothetical protein